MWKPWKTALREKAAVRCEQIPPDKQVSTEAESPPPQFPPAEGEALPVERASAFMIFNKHDPQRTKRAQHAGRKDGRCDGNCKPTDDASVDAGSLTGLHPRLGEGRPIRTDLEMTEDLQRDRETVPVTVCHTFKTLRSNAGGMETNPTSRGETTRCGMSSHETGWAREKEEQRSLRKRRTPPGMQRERTARAAELRSLSRSQTDGD